MAHIVCTSEAVEAYLFGPAGLSDDGRRRLVTAYLSDLAGHADEFLRVSPLAPGSQFFRYEHILMDQGVFRYFRFVVDGSRIAERVVTVVFVDCDPPPTRGASGVD